MPLTPTFLTNMSGWTGVTPIPTGLLCAACSRATSIWIVVHYMVRTPKPQNLGAECVRYEQEVQAAAIGLQILGIGSNGHIAFNEPGTPFDSVTRVVELSGQTRNDNARFFPAGHSVPAQAMTQGIATILAASELLLVACGAGKASAVARAIEGPITDAVPASAIQLHSKVVVVLDPLAAQGLQ